MTEEKILQEESTTPPVAENTQEATQRAATGADNSDIAEDISTRYAALSKRMDKILKARKRLGKFQNIVAEKEQAKKTADAELKAAIGDRDQATLELERVIDDEKSGQQTLPGVEEILDDEPEKKFSGDWLLNVLGTSELAKHVPADRIAQQKAIDDPIGLTDSQIEKLESACESQKLAGLEKWICEDAYWHQKIKGFGEKAIQRVVSTLTAFRSVHPMDEVQEVERAPTVVESLASKNATESEAATVA